MTIRDPEILELLGDKPELLALSDAVAETQQQPRRRRRLRLTAPRLLSIAAAVAMVIIVFLFAPGGGGNHSIIDRALAAIGNGRVLHVVSESPTGTVFVDLKSGRRTIQTMEVEIWFDRPSKRAHMTLSLKGKVVGDLLLPDDARKPGVTLSGGIDPAFTALALGYREALANGDAKLERQGMVGGRPVYWLRFPSFQRNLPGTEVAIDKKSYKPVLFRTHLPRNHHSDERVLVAETTGFREADFSRRGPSLLEGEESLLTGSSSSDIPVRPPHVNRPWLTPGTRALGLKLISVNRVRVTTKGHTFHGVELVYGKGRQRSFPAPLVIEETARSAEPALWRSIPRGSVSIQQGDTGVPPRLHRSWTGYVAKRGIYVTISIERRGERAVVAVARALHAAP
jgi:hypothetical protein